MSIFGITNLTEAMANSIAAWKFNQKQLKSLFLHPEAFKFIFRSNSCLPSISRCCPVTPSTHTFPNISLYKGDGKFTYCLENDWKRAAMISISILLLFWVTNHFFSNSTFSSLPCKSVNPNFWQNQSDRNSDRFNCCLESR